MKYLIQITIPDHIMRKYDIASKATLSLWDYLTQVAEQIEADHDGWKVELKEGE